MRIKESKNINKSLFFLTQIIHKLAEKEINHIPFRNSSLTKLLKNSIGGNSSTMIVLCVNPFFKNLELTINTFNFGNFAMKISN